MKKILILLLLLSQVSLAQKNKNSFELTKPNSSVYLFDKSNSVGAELMNGRKVMSNDLGEIEFWFNYDSDEGRVKSSSNYMIEFNFTSYKGELLTGFESFDSDELKKVSFASYEKGFIKFEQNLTLDSELGVYKNDNNKPWLLTSNMFGLKEKDKLKEIKSIDVKELSSFIQDNLALTSKETQTGYNLILDLNKFMGNSGLSSTKDYSDWSSCVSNILQASGTTIGTAAACYVCYNTVGTFTAACAGCLGGSLVTVGSAMSTISACNIYFPDVNSTIIGGGGNENGSGYGSPYGGGGGSVWIPITQNFRTCSETGGETECWTETRIVGYILLR